MISRDTKVLDPSSEVAGRMIKYGGLVDRLDIVVFSSSLRQSIRLSPRLVIYPANFFSVLSVSSRVLNDSGSNLVTTQDPFWAGLVGVLLRKKSNLRLEMQVHTDFLSPYFNGFRNYVYKKMALWILGRADCVRVVSRRIKNSLEMINLKLKISMLPIYTPLPKTTNENIRGKYNQYDFIILMVSRLSKEKNIGLAIDAMAEIVKEFPKTLLLIVGDGPEAGSLKFKVQSSKLEKNVIFAGWKDALGDYYKSADLYLLTSDFEGWGRTVIEAAYMGVPVVMSHVGLAGEVIEHGKSGFLFKPRGVKALVEILRKVISGEVSTPASAEEARKRVSSYLDEEAYLRKLKKIWELCGF